MTQEGLSMRKVREILRLRIGCGLSARAVAKSCKVSHSTVLEYHRRAIAAGLGWPLPEEMDDAALERIVCGPPDAPTGRREMPETGYLVSEMKRPHVTLYLLWVEYKAANPDGYQYTQFCQRYSEAKKLVDVVLRQEHRAGEKLFTDYAGDTIDITDPRTGKVNKAYIFVAVLGASNYTYAEATTDLCLPSWIASHIRALEYFGGVPQIVAPDNTKWRGYQTRPLRAGPQSRIRRYGGALWHRDNPGPRAETP